MKAELRFALIPVKVVRLSPVQCGRLKYLETHDTHRVWMKKYIRWETPFRGIKLVDVRDLDTLRAYLPP